MACGAERVQPSIIGGPVRLVELRPRAHSPTHAAPSARGGPQSKHPQLTRDASRGPSRMRSWGGARRIGVLLLPQEICIETTFLNICSSLLAIYTPMR